MATLELGYMHPTVKTLTQTLETLTNTLIISRLPQHSTAQLANQYAITLSALTTKTLKITNNRLKDQLLTATNVGLSTLNYLSPPDTQQHTMALHRHALEHVPTTYDDNIPQQTFWNCVLASSPFNMIELTQNPETTIDETLTQQLTKLSQAEHNKLKNNASGKNQEKTLTDLQTPLIIDVIIIFHNTLSRMNGLYYLLKIDTLLLSERQLINSALKELYGLLRDSSNALQESTLLQMHKTLQETIAIVQTTAADKIIALDNAIQSTTSMNSSSHPDTLRRERSLTATDQWLQQVMATKLEESKDSHEPPTTAYHSAINRLRQTSTTAGRHPNALDLRLQRTARPPRNP